MGPSTSYSFSKPSLFNWALDCVRRCGIGNKTEHWVAIIVSSKFTTKSFKSAAKFPLSSQERKTNQRMRDESTNPVECQQCGVMFLRSENKFGQCTRHKEKLVCMLDPIPRLAVDEIPQSETKERFEQYRYQCCHAPYDAQHRNGCILGIHEWDEDQYDSRDSYNNSKQAVNAPLPSPNNNPMNLPPPTSTYTATNTTIPSWNYNFVNYPPASNVALPFPFPRSLLLPI